MRRLLLVAPVAFTAFVIGCPNGEPPPPPGVKDQRVAIPDPPANGVQIVGPEITIPAGSDHMFCWVPDFVPTEDHLVKQFAGFQGASGHHIIAMESVVPRNAGDVFDCTEVTQMTTIRPLIIQTSGNMEGTGNLLPDGFAVRLPAGASIVMQSHYVNVNTEDIIIRDVANLVYVDEGEQVIEANYFTLNDGEFAVPATNEHYTHSATCTINQDLKFATLMGHMHEWGKHITLEKIDSTGAASTEYDIPDWTAQFRDLAPINDYPLEAPLTFAAGDKLRITCDWVNDTADALDFPHEMCVGIGAYYPAIEDGFIICDNDPSP